MTVGWTLLVLAVAALFDGITNLLLARRIFRHTEETRIMAEMLLQRKLGLSPEGEEKAKIHKSAADSGHWWGGNPHSVEPPGHFPEDEQ